MFANVVGRGPAGVNPQVAALAPAQLLQGLCKRREASLSFRILRCPIREYADAPHALVLLRDRRERPRRRAAEKPYELPPFYSITSSARASREGGTSRPSALAVLRLITVSYLVGACTGRSAGFSPLRMRST